eukprot:767758-Hanusia_phi.AAC.3
MLCSDFLLVIFVYWIVHFRPEIVPKRFELQTIHMVSQLSVTVRSSCSSYLSYSFFCLLLLTPSSPQRAPPLPPPPPTRRFRASSSLLAMITTLNLISCYSGN